MPYKVGLDIGSTTMKAIVLNEQDQIVYKSYERHKAKVREMAVQKIAQLEDLLTGKELQFAISGSAGMQLAEDGEFGFVQEVFASAHAVRKYYPETDVVVELGGEDAKIIYLSGSLEERMNSTCAGGTGAFIDQMASLLNVSLEEMDELSLHYERLYPIASRCGVFAKSDIQPLINQGVGKENLAASIFQSVVDQTIIGLAQGRAIEGNVLFLGGPLFFFKGLQNRFKESLNLDQNSAQFPDMGPYFVALGTALYAKEEPVITYNDLNSRMQAVTSKKQTYAGLDPLFQNDQEYLDFLERHRKSHVERKQIQSYQGNAYLGIDAGSTTTKLVLLDEDHNILYESYQNNQGSPLEIIQTELTHIYDICGERIKIAGSAVTGYGEELLKHAYHIDIGIVETIAHYTAAKYFNPNVDFIIDIGGQDMKCFRIKDNSIDDIILNEACSSGCGSFIETFAKSMGYTAEEFAVMGLAAKHPVDLGSRCTVFMNSSVKQAQKNGAGIEDISAGLCISVVKNALYKVIRAKRPEDLGSEIIVQGGTFLNDTVLRSFEKELNREVIRPDIAGLMGAYGAALIAQQKQKSPSQLISKEELVHFTHSSLSVRCGLCTNHCSLTVNTFQDGSKYIAGNKCERPKRSHKKSEQLPNLYTYKYEYLRSLTMEQRQDKTIGIPVVLNMYDLLPFWKTLFQECGYDVVLSAESSSALYKSAQQTIPSDTACYPAKLVHGHIQDLIKKQVPFIFFPSMSYNIDEHMSDDHYNCPIVAYYGQLIEANMEMKDSVLLSPFLTLNKSKKLIQSLLSMIQENHLEIEEQQLKHAVEKAYQALEAWRMSIKEEGKRAMAYAKAHGKHMIVLSGRPYHIDPQIHHGIHQLLHDLGFVVLSEDALPYLGKAEVEVLNQWTYHARMYNAANFVEQHSDMDLVQLVSFGCGLDAITADEIKDQLRNHGKLYTQIKIDEVDNLGAVRIRLRSLKEAIEERGGKVCSE